MSRVLQSSTNMVTNSYANHKGWSKGVDVVRYYAQTAPIIAHSDGEVIKVINYKAANDHTVDHEGMGYGNYVMIKHSNNVVTLYAHLNAVYVRVGQIVKAGDKIADMGNTGNSFGAHLHFEVRLYSKFANNLQDTTTYKWVDPTPYLDADLPKKEETKQTEYYRVRLSWDNPKSQLGAYKVLANAKKKADENPGYKVFDDNGGYIYG